MNPLQKLQSARSAQQLANSVLQSEHSKMIGQKVRINDKYAKWLEKNLDQLFTRPGASSPEEDQSYKFCKKNIKERFWGEVVSSRFDEDGVTLKVKFKEKIKGKKVEEEMNLCVENLELK